MTPIVNHPSLDWLGNGRWRLSNTLRCIDDELGELEVPAGYETDLDSVPRLPLAHLLLKGRTVTAAIFHDYAYEHGSIGGRLISRRDADRLFMRLMKDENVWWWRRSLIYTGVRLGGHFPWKRYRG